MLCMKIRKEASIEAGRGERKAFLRKLERKFQRLSMKKRLHSENKEEGPGRIEGEATELEMGDSEPFSMGVMREGATSQLLKNGEEFSNQMVSYGDKLAEAERRLNEQIKDKKKKRTQYKTIIEENENYLKALSRQMKDVEDTIKKKEDKIVEMKIERNDRPLLKKFGTQFHIAKSTLRKERLQDDLSVMKSQSASRRRKIQKYKTKIRYDLQILHDPFNVCTSVPTAKQATRLVPGCFYASALPASTSTCQEDGKQQLVTTSVDNGKDSTSATHNSDWKEHVTLVKEKLSSSWSLSSILEDEVFLVQQTPGGPSGSAGKFCRSPSSTGRMAVEKECRLASCEEVSSVSSGRNETAVAVEKESRLASCEEVSSVSSGYVGLYDLEGEEGECVIVGKDCKSASAMFMQQKQY